MLRRLLDAAAAHSIPCLRTATSRKPVRRWHDANGRAVRLRRRRCSARSTSGSSRWPGPPSRAELDLGSGYGWIFSAGSLAYGAVVMPAETLLGRVSATRLLAAGLALATAGIVIVASAADVAAALAGRVLFGAGAGMAAAPALVLLAEDDAAFARMGGAIALGFSAGVLLGAGGAWRTSLVTIAALAAAAAGAAATVTPRAPAARRATAGALRIGGATAAAGAALAMVRVDPLAAGGALLIAGALAASGWRAARLRLARPRGGVLVACVAGAATTMSGVAAMVLLGLSVVETPSPADELALALFGLATLGAVGIARRLAVRLGPLGAAAAGLAGQGLAILAIASGPVLLVPSIALFGAAHVVANAGAAAAVMRHAGEGAATAAGLYATGQYVAAGAGPLLVLSVGSGGMALAGTIALAGAALVATSQRRAPIHSASRSP